jgi:hypothetical protein
MITKHKMLIHCLLIGLKSYTLDKAQFKPTASAGFVSQVILPQNKTSNEEMQQPPMTGSKLILAKVPNTLLSMLTSLLL